MLCARCGHDNPPESNFCSSCGAPLVTDDDSTVDLDAVGEEEEEGALPSLDDLPEGMGMLVVRRGPNAGSSYLLDTDVTTAGRHPDSNIFLDDITVSRRHARFVREDEGYRVADIGSLNGTYVNRERVEEAPLRNGDEVQIGRYRLAFLVGGS